MSEAWRQLSYEANIDIKCKVHLSYIHAEGRPRVAMKVFSESLADKPFPPDQILPPIEAEQDIAVLLPLIDDKAFEIVLTHMGTQVVAQVASLPILLTRVALLSAQLASVQQVGDMQPAARRRTEKAIVRIYLNHMRRILRAVVDQSTTPGPKPKELPIAKITRAIKRAPDPRKARLEDVAERLGVNRRTIIRALAREGTSWKLLKRQTLQEK